MLDVVGRVVGRWGAGLALVVGLGACGDEDTRPGVGQDTLTAADLFGDADAAGDTAQDAAPDAQADTAVADTAVADTVIADTVIADTVVADTVPADTAVADTAVVDTAVADTAQEVTTPAPDPGQAGPYTVAKEVVEVAGLEAEWYLPEVAGKVPAIVLAPGFQLDGSTLGWLASHLASHGIGVLVPTFGDGAFTAFSHDELGDLVVEMLDWLERQGEVDAAAIGTGGHSRGGKAAMLAAARDTRPKVVLGLDPVDALPPGQQASADNPSVAPELMGQVKAALGLMGSEYGPTAVFPGAPVCAPAGEGYDAYASSASAAAAKHTWLIAKSGHNDFADPLPGLLALACKGGDVPADTRARAKVLATAFLKRYLAGDLRYQTYL